MGTGGGGDGAGGGGDGAGGVDDGAEGTRFLRTPSQNATIRRKRRSLNQCKIVSMASCSPPTVAGMLICTPPSSTPRERRTSMLVGQQLSRRRLVSQRMHSTVPSSLLRKCLKRRKMPTGRRNRDTTFSTQARGRDWHGNIGFLNDKPADVYKAYYEKDLGKIIPSSGYIGGIGKGQSMTLLLYLMAASSISSETRIHQSDSEWNRWHFQERTSTHKVLRLPICMP